MRVCPFLVAVGLRLDLHGAGFRPIPLYMIAPKKLFHKRIEALEELGFAPRRVSPRNFNEEMPPCEPNTGNSPIRFSELGCFESHRSAWKRIANRERVGMVLEADWTIGNQSVELLKQDFREVVAKMNVGDYDLAWAGRCGGRAYCTTAYFIKPDAARLLHQDTMCTKNVPLDHFMNSECGRKPFHAPKNSTVWMKGRAVATQLRHLACGAAPEYKPGTENGPAYFAGLYGDGPFFQDRRMKGIHQRTGHKQTDMKEISPTVPHDTYAFPLGEAATQPAAQPAAHPAAQ